MNDGKDRTASEIEIRGYHPHPCDFINLLGDVTEPLQKRTGVTDAAKTLTIRL